MSHGTDQSPCPEASTLAAFVEGTLDDKARGAVEHHVADCSECVFAIAQTVRFLGPSLPDAVAPARAWGLSWAAAMLAFVALCIPAFVWYSANATPLQRLKRLAADAQVRATEGRLDGFAHVPFDVHRSASSAAEDLSLRAEAAHLAELPEDRRSALHAKGVALLFVGNASGARTILAETVRRTPRDASAWNDLAAAELAGSGGDISLALAAADGALALDPGLHAAHFNRALALERLGRRRDARREYERVVRLEPSSPWSAEARERITRMVE